MKNIKPVHSITDTSHMLKLLTNQIQILKTHITDELYCPKAVTGPI